jgi:hypothetical protein
MTANRAIRQIQPLLDQTSHTITPAHKRLHIAADLMASAISTGAITPRPTQRVDHLQTLSVVNRRPHRRQPA